MKHTLFLALLVLCCACLAQTPVWFPDIQGAARITPEAALQLTAQLREGLLAGKSPAALAALAPDDPTPRALFITLGDGVFPGRTYYAVGATFRETLQLLLEITLRREQEYVEAIRNELASQAERAQEEKRLLPVSVRLKMERPEAWNSLRLDIVQAVMPVKEYVISSYKLLLTNAVGIAFDPVSTFAFPPEQLTGRCLMTDEHQLSVPRISNLIAESTNWGAYRLWLKMGAAEVGFNASVFESDSYYADAAGACRLFRGHPVGTGGLDSPQEPAAEARALARLLRGSLSAKGRLNAPFPEWFYEREDSRNPLSDQAALVYALALAAQQPGTPAALRKDFLDGAANAAQPLFNALKHYDKDEKRSANPQQPAARRRKARERDFACLVEDEDQPEAIAVVSRRLAQLHTAALAYLAFEQLAGALPEASPVAKRAAAALRPLAAHIRQQLRPDGTFVHCLLYPEMTPFEENPPGPVGRAETAALAGLALDRHARLVPAEDTPERQAARAQWRRLLIQRTIDKSVANPPLTPWLPVYLCETAAPREQALYADLARFAITASNNLEKNPVFPDMFGAPRDIPSATYAAERLWLVAEIAAFLARNGHAEDGRGLLQSAWPLWVFAQQADVSPATASVLAEPRRYIGFQRDNLADFGFTLNGQVTHLLTRLALGHALHALKLPRLAPTAQDAERHQKCWAQLQNHPICLFEGIVVPGNTPGPENKRAAGRFDRSTLTVQSKQENRPIKAGAGTPSMSSKAPPPASFQQRVLRRHRR